MKEPELRKCPICWQPVKFGFTTRRWPRGIWCPFCHLKADWDSIPKDGSKTAEEAMKELADRWNKREMESVGVMSHG